MYNNLIGLCARCDHKYLSTEGQAGHKEHQEYTMDTTKVKE
jgi:hypothetical protein